MMDMAEYLVQVASRQASDLFISVGAPPMVNIDGSMVPIDSRVIGAEEARTLIYSVLNDDQTSEFERTLELNIALQVEGAGRFRVNLFNQRGEPAAVCRYIKDRVPGFEELGLPEKLKEIVMEQRGLVLVVGGTGTGKSTTLAAMIHHRANARGGHILSIEDPIEFIHQHARALVNQREVGIDTHSYADALKNALREAPNVILIGEIRDDNTMKHALSYAETGHLCLATLHASNSNQALDRIINFFPETAHHQILVDLSLHLKSIVSQRLCQGIKGGRVAAFELLFNTGHVQDLISKGKLAEVKEAMTRSSSRVHRTFDEDLYDLYEKGKISEEVALRQADSRNNLSLKIRLNRGKTGKLHQIEKEVSFNRKAPFEQYGRFSLKPLQVSKKRRADADKVLATAMITAFEDKGLQYSTKEADVEVQYSFGMKEIKGLALAEIQNQSDNLSALAADSDHEATLLINIRDLRFNRDVWRLQARQRIDAGEPNRSQVEINVILMDLLQDYPALN